MAGVIVHRRIPLIDVTEEIIVVNAVMASVLQGRIMLRSIVIIKSEGSRSKREMKIRVMRRSIVGIESERSVCMTEMVSIIIVQLKR